MSYQFLGCLCLKNLISLTGHSLILLASNVEMLDCPSWKLSSNRKSSLTKTKLIGEESDFTQSFLRDLKKHLKILLICKSLWICLLMMFFYQFAGYTLVVSFAGKLLKQECTHLLDSTSNLTNNEMNPR